MTRRFGQEATTYLAEPLLAGIHAGDVNRLSLHGLFPRFAEAEARYGSLLRAFRKPSPTPPIPDGPFRSLPGGMSELVNAVAATLPAGAVALNTPVTAVQRQGDHLAVVTGTETRIARAVVVAAPAYAAAAMLRSLNPTEADLAGQVPYHSAGTILLAYRREDVRHPLQGSGFVVPSVERSPITAGSWLSSKWAGRAPAGAVILRAFVGGARDAHALERTDAELVDIAIRALDPLLGLKGAPIQSRVYRFPRANAQHEVGHLERMAAIDRALAQTPGLFLTGSGFRGVGIPDVVADVRATAKQVRTWLDASI
jgi:oxygen-dependent protoporphyrinogen oxidase